MSWIQACTVSLIILALGVPRIPYETANAIILHLPAGFMPVHANASDSSAEILESEKPEA